MAGNQQLAFAVRAVNEASQTLKDIQGDLDVTGKKAEQSSGLLDKFGLSLGAIALAAPAAALGLGAAALKFGGDFDAAFDTIRSGTGATGENLKALEQDFKSVLKNVPTDFESAATAVADLNTRTGQTGKGLQELSEQVLDLSRLTGTDVAQNVADATRLFGDWGVAAEDQSEVMDKLFRASQASGAGFNDIAQSVVQFGAPLRNLGFSLEDSVALFSKWEKEGVNAETVMSGLKQSVSKFAREGVDAKDGLRDTIKRIQEMGAGAEATGLAIETFGSRAGPDMAAAILEGRFEIEDYLASIEDGTDTISGVAAETDDWREKLTLLKNRGLVALEPVLSSVFTHFTNFVDLISTQVVPWMEEHLIPAFETFGTFVGTNIVPALQTFGAFVQESVLPALSQLGTWVQTTALPVLQELAAWVGEKLVATFQRLSERMTEELGKLRAYWETDLKPTLDRIRDFFEVVIGAIVGFFRDHWPQIEKVIRPVLEQVENVINTTFESVKRIIATVLDIIQGDWEGAWENVKGLVKTILNGVKETIENGMELAQGALEAAVPLFLSAAEKLGGAIFDGLMKGLKALPGLAGDIAEQVWSALKAVLNSGIALINDWIPNTLGYGPFSINIPDNPIPKLARGGTALTSGLALVGERGPELVRLPAGAQVWSHNDSMEIARSLEGGRRGASGGGDREGVIVQFNAPVTIEAQDRRAAERSAENFGYSISSALRARGAL